MVELGMTDDEEMALNLGRSCRIASIERQMDELWGMFLMRPSRLNSNDFLWMMSIASIAKLILEMDQDQPSASSASTSTSPTPNLTGDSTSARPANDSLNILQSSVTVSQTHPTTDA